MAGDLIATVRRRYLVPLASGTGAPSLLGNDAFVRAVTERWEEEGWWIESHLAELAGKAGDDRSEGGTGARPPSRETAQEPPTRGRARAAGRGAAAPPEGTPASCRSSGDDFLPPFGEPREHGAVDALLGPLPDAGGSGARASAASRAGGSRGSGDAPLLRAPSDALSGPLSVGSEEERQGDERGFGRAEEEWRKRGF